MFCEIEVNLPNFSTQATHSSYPADRTGTIKAWAAKYIKINHGDSDLQIHFEANHEIDITAIRKGSGENISTVTKYTITDSLTQLLPAITDDYSYIILVITNKSNAQLDYSYSITETESDVDENAICNGFSAFVYPNPVNFNKQNLNIDIAEIDKNFSSDKIEFFNLKGQKVRTLSLWQKIDTWDGRDDRGKSVPAGIYFYKITVEGREQTNKIVVIK